MAGKVKTHAGGQAFDRILVSDSLLKGIAGLKIEKVEIVQHRHGKREERRLYADHFPVVASFHMLER